MKLSRLMLSTHQGLGLLIGIQVFLWISGGFVMSVLPLEKVRGEDWITEPVAASMPTGQSLRAPDVVAVDLGLADFDGAELRLWLDQPVYQLSAAGEDHLADAVTGQKLSPLTAGNAREVAQRDYAGPGTVAEVALLEEGLLEIRGRDLPLWRVGFDDSRHTTIYVSPQTGEVVGRRNTIWRVYDFFWMLHIMDYSARDNFNNPLLVTCAVVAWFLATSGIWLVVIWLKRKSRRKKTA